MTELEIYKKAFELACEFLDEKVCDKSINTLCCVNNCEYFNYCLHGKWKEYFLQKTDENLHK